MKHLLSIVFMLIVSVALAQPVAVVNDGGALPWPQNDAGLVDNQWFESDVLEEDLYYVKTFPLTGVGLHDATHEFLTIVCDDDTWDLTREIYPSYLSRADLYDNPNSVHTAVSVGSARVILGRKCGYWSYTLMLRDDFYLIFINLTEDINW